MNDYSAFLAAKRITSAPAGFDVNPDAINSLLFPFQRDIVRWALRRGRAAIFADCGLGKTPMQLEWAHHVTEHTDRPVLILAPLAVSQQTAREGAKFGISVTVCASQDDVQSGINITNYEKLHHFDPSVFSGIVLDESSILKAYDGSTRTAIIEAFSRTPYKLACTATPAPNDHMELGNHAEFLGTMSRVEMLSMFFVHDGGDTSKWRLKGHAETEFWKWVCSWAVMMRKPSDLGYTDDGFILPPLNLHSLIVEGEAPEGYLFPVEAQTLIERRAARRGSLGARVEACAELATGNDEPWLIWCDLNAEGDALEKIIGGAVQVAGSDAPEFKERAMLDFAAGAIRVLITKPSIAGFGMNWQHCPNVAFVGLSDSYEAFYQAIRRCWRFGQARPVQCHIITSESEGAIVVNIRRKEQDAIKMAEGMVKHMSTINAQELRGTEHTATEYRATVTTGRDYTAHLGDCVETVAAMESESIDYSIFSPPFASLYTYSNSERDMGNCKDASEFYEHFVYLVQDLYRVLKSGRLLSFHCMNLPTTKQRDGFIGIADFRGDLIRMFQSVGFIYHSEVLIWKDPVTAMQRTKALGLLYKQLRKDSAMSRQGIPDYLVTMRKPGANPNPVTKDPDEFSVDLWQRYASPVWFDINPSDTLQKESAREAKDEKHICPLQLEVIERALRLWTNPGDLVLSPFMGIGSEGHEAIRLGRRFVGVELKESYWRQACINLDRAEQLKEQPTLFDLLEGVA
jgi:DNA modification methylase